jgi:hypothetical protein
VVVPKNWCRKGSTCHLFIGVYQLTHANIQDCLQISLKPCRVLVQSTTLAIQQVPRRYKCSGGAGLQHQVRPWYLICKSSYTHISYIYIHIHTNLGKLLRPHCDLTIMMVQRHIPSHGRQMAWVNGQDAVPGHLQPSLGTPRRRFFGEDHDLKPFHGDWTWLNWNVAFFVGEKELNIRVCMSMVSKWFHPSMYWNYHFG